MSIQAKSLEEVFADHKQTDATYTGTVTLSSGSIGGYTIDLVELESSNCSSCAKDHEPEDCPMKKI